MQKHAALLLMVILLLACALPGARAESSVADSLRRLFGGERDEALLYGTDDPSLLPVHGKHAFVVLGNALQNGEMTDELKGRCDAAAAAARAFPASILICSGGATGENNPEGHTEAGLMKAYLTETHGSAPARIFIDERAADTAENAVNTFYILREQGIESMTLVTSSYHQARAQVLYNAVSARFREMYGYSVDAAGSFCLDIAPADDLYVLDALTAMVQLANILNPSGE